MKTLLVSIFVFLFTAASVYAAPATLSFDPIQIQTSKDQSFQVNINIFSENEPVASTDIVIIYDPTLIEALPEETSSGNLFKTVDAKIISPGRLYVYGVQENKNEATPARGTIATVHFKALTEGNSQLSFDCTNNGSNSSQIIKFNSTFENIIDCNATLTHKADIGISNSSVLGAFSDTYSGLGRYTFLLGSIVVIFTCYIIIRYSRLHKDIT